MRSAALGRLLLAFLAWSGPALCAETATPGEPAWSGAVTGMYYAMRDQPDFGVGVASLNHGPLHLEARYNYEARDSGSAFVGWKFAGGDSVSYELTPIIGALFGAARGVVPGLEASIGWRSLDVYVEAEYVRDLDESSASYFYSWTELGWKPVEWLRIGLVGQRTHDHRHRSRPAAWRLWSTDRRQDDARSVRLQSRLRQPLCHLLHRGAVLANAITRMQGYHDTQGHGSRAHRRTVACGSDNAWQTPRSKWLRRMRWLMKLQLRTVLLAACLTLATAWSNARADEVPLVTGEHWTKSSEQVKKAYLIGIANILQVETAYHGASPPSDAQSVVPRFAKGLKGGAHTLDSVREGVDKWYAANPDKTQRPVIEIIWFEMVVPGLQKSK